MITHARIVLRAEASAAKAARDFLADACPARSSAILADAQLLLSELVTNAVRHGIGPIEVDVACGPGCDGVDIRVRDRSDQLPRPRHATTQEEGGRGLALLDNLSDAWGVDPGPPGKAVWFRLAPA